MIQHIQDKGLIVTPVSPSFNIHKLAFAFLSHTTVFLYVYLAIVYICTICIMYSLLMALYLNLSHHLQQKSLYILFILSFSRVVVRRRSLSPPASILLFNHIASNRNASFRHDDLPLLFQSIYQSQPRP